MTTDYRARNTCNGDQSLEGVGEGDLVQTWDAERVENGRSGPDHLKEGSGPIVSGTAATQATNAALSSYTRGILDRVVRLSNGESEVHEFGVNWPHHIFCHQQLRGRRRQTNTPPR